MASRALNIPNLLTYARIVAVPLIVLCFFIGTIATLDASSAEGASSGSEDDAEPPKTKPTETDVSDEDSARPKKREAAAPPESRGDGCSPEPLPPADLVVAADLLYAYFDPRIRYGGDD